MKWVLIAISALIFSQNMQAQWQVEARNCASSAYNSQVFFFPQEKLRHATSIHLGFRADGQPGYKLQDQFVCYPGQALPLLKNYQLPAGKYQLEVHFNDSDLPSLELPFECMDKKQDPFLSDVYLSTFAFPKIGPKAFHLSRIGANSGQLFFHCELLSRRHQLLTARAVLYRERQQGFEAKATVFTSIQQENKVLTLAEGKAIFEGELLLKGLSSGNYLLEIFIFEDDQLLRERSVRFSLDWQGHEALMAQIDEAIQMLTPIASQEDIHRLLALPDAGAKRNAFEAWWQQYAGDNISEKMATYYEKLLEADSLFDDSLPVWQSDRAKAYLFYGKPIRRELVKNGTRYERWYYEEWDLLLWFKAEGANFVRIK